MKTSSYFSLLLGFVLFMPLKMEAEITFQRISSQLEYQTELARAENEGKLVFIELEADWCGYCRKLEAETFTDEKLANHFNENFVNISMNGEEGYGRELMKMYEFEGFPALLILTAQGELIKKAAGYQEVGELMDIAKAAVKIGEKLGEWILADEKGKLQVGDALDYCELLRGRDETEIAEAVATRSLSKIKKTEDLMPYKSWSLIEENIHSIGNPVLERVVAEREAFIHMRGEAEVTSFFVDVVLHNVSEAVDTENEALMLQAVEEYAPYMIDQDDDPAELREAMLELKLAYYTSVESYVKYVETFDNYAAQYHANDASFYYEKAQSLLENEDSDLFGPALKWTEKGLGIEETLEGQIVYVMLLYYNDREADARKMTDLMKQQYANDEQKYNTTIRLIEWINE